MDNKEAIINEYVIGRMSLRGLEKKYGISRSTAEVAKNGITCR